jgi:ATP-binding cassette subfamily F protein uup
MLAQRGADLTRAPAVQEKDTTVKALTANAAPLAQKRKLKFKEKHALETLPKTIAGLQSKADELQAMLADPQFYQRDRAGFEKATSDLGEAQRKLAAAEEQWLELEILREDIAGG